MTEPGWIQSGLEILEWWWLVTILPLIYVVGMIKRIKARRLFVTRGSIRSETLWRTIFGEASEIVSDPKLARTKWRRWAMGKKDIGVASQHEWQSPEERVRHKIEQELGRHEENMQLGIGSETGDLLEACPLCGHWLATRTKAKNGDRDAFICEQCGEHDLSGTEIVVRQRNSNPTVHA